MYIEIELAVMLHDFRLIVLELIIPILIKGLAHTHTIIHVLKHDHVAEVGVDVGLAAAVAVAAHSGL